MDSKKWLARITGGASVAAIAEQAQIPRKTLDTQLRSPKGLAHRHIIDIARAYGASPVRALVESGALNIEEARDVAGLRPLEVAEALGDADDRELLEEIGRRLDARCTEVDIDPDPDVEEP